MPAKDVNEELIEKQKRILLEIVRLLGSRAVIARILKIERSQVSRWMNGEKRRRLGRRWVPIPYEHALRLSKLTHFSIKELAPYCEWANEFLEPLLLEIVMRPRCIQADKILHVKKTSYSLFDDYQGMYTSLEHPLLLTRESFLISPIKRMQGFIEANYQFIPVFIIDLNSLYKKEIDISMFDPPLLLCDLVALGLWLEDFVVEKMRGFFEENNINMGFELEPSYPVIQKDRDCSCSKKLSCTRKLSVLGGSTEERQYFELRVRTNKNSRFEGDICLNNKKIYFNEINTEEKKLKFVANRMGFEDEKHYCDARNLAQYGNKGLLEKVEGGQVLIEEASQILKGTSILKC
ncbi:MAG: hypothetical protein K0R24_1610 [Gammaproteobacteria bacterium]|nr:hypothetical protein [Gammaproteobacteria bacterium]